MKNIWTRKYLNKEAMEILKKILNKRGKCQDDWRRKAFFVQGSKAESKEVIKKERRQVNDKVLNIAKQ